MKIEPDLALLSVFRTFTSNYAILAYVAVPNPMNRSPNSLDERS